MPPSTVLLLQVAATFVYIGQQVGINLGGKVADPSRLQFFYYIFLTLGVGVTQVSALVSGDFAASLRATPWVYTMASVWGLLGAAAACVAAIGFARFPIPSALITGVMPLVFVPLVMFLCYRLWPLFVGNQSLEPYKVVCLGITITGLMGFFVWPQVQAFFVNAFTGAAGRVASLAS